MVLPKAQRFYLVFVFGGIQFSVLPRERVTYRHFLDVMMRLQIHLNLLDLLLGTADLLVSLLRFL